MKIEIKSWLDGGILFAGEFGSLKIAVEAAVSKGISLNYARLDGARLDGARLDGARLDGARLVRASLDGARLDGARLVRARLDGACLDGARLVRARLDGACLDGARLVRARLDGACLDGARLDGARLDGARLDGARLDPIKNDLWVVLCTSPLEVPGLRKALLDGRVNGSTYEGECACLVGTIANVKGCKFNAMPNLKPDSDRPIERFFLAIRKGDTPENSQFAKLAVEWIDEWQRNINQLVCK